MFTKSIINIPESSIPKDIYRVEANAARAGILRADYMSLYALLDALPGAPDIRRAWDSLLLANARRQEAIEILATPHPCMGLGNERTEELLDQASIRRLVRAAMEGLLDIPTPEKIVQRLEAILGKLSTDEPKPTEIYFLSEHRLYSALGLTRQLYPNLGTTSVGLTKGGQETFDRAITLLKSWRRVEKVDYGYKFQRIN